MFFLPYSHDRTVKRDVPWVTIAIAGLCIAAWIATVTIGTAPEGFALLASDSAVPPEWAGNPLASVYFSLGLVSAKPTFTAVISHAFLHGGMLHLAGNLLFLMLTAPYLEDEWGKTGFGLFYLFAIFASAATWLYAFPASTVPLVGASGAIAACLGAFTFKFGWSNMKVFYVLFPWNLIFRSKAVGVATLPAWTVLGLWFAEQALYTANFGTGEGGVAYAVHAGGFVGGLGLAMVLRLLNLDSSSEEELEPAFPLYTPVSVPASSKAA